MFSCHRRCLFVCARYSIRRGILLEDEDVFPLADYAKLLSRFFSLTKFGRKAAGGSRKKPLDSGGNLDHVTVMVSK